MGALSRCVEMHTAVNHVRITKHTFILIYGDLIQSGLDQFTNMRRHHFNTNKAMLDMYVESEIVVEMQCNPIISVEDIERLHMLGIMDKKVMAEHAFSQYALPKTQISVREWPDMVPKELLGKSMEKPSSSSSSSTTEKNAYDSEPKKKKPKKDDSLKAATETK